MNHNEALEHISVLESSIKDAKVSVDEGETRTAQLQGEIKEAGTSKMKLEEEILGELEDIRVSSMNQGKKEAGDKEQLPKTTSFPQGGHC